MIGNKQTNFSILLVSYLYVDLQNCSTSAENLWYIFIFKNEAIFCLQSLDAVIWTFLMMKLGHVFPFSYLVICHFCHCHIKLFPVFQKSTNRAFWYYNYRKRFSDKTPCDFISGVIFCLDLPKKTLEKLVLFLIELFL